MSLYDEWIAAKEIEREAIERRRIIEDKLTDELALLEAEGSKTIRKSGFCIKVTQRFNRRIDSDILQEIAAENGIEHLLGNLFRWKPEIDLKAWKSTDESLTKPLLNAIITTPGRPSYLITKDEK